MSRKNKWKGKNILFPQNIVLMPQGYVIFVRIENIRNITGL